MSNQREPERWSDGWAGLVVAGLLWSAAAGADSWRSELTCQLAVEDQPSLTAPLVQRIKQRVEAVFSIAYGRSVRLHWAAGDLTAPDGAGGGGRTRTNMLSRWRGPGRLLLVQVAYQSGHYSITAVEYEPRFRIAGPAVAVQTRQRTLVADAVARAALRAYTPMGTVSSVSDGRWLVQFPDGGCWTRRLAWVGLGENAAFELLRDETLADAASGAGRAPFRRTRYRRSFLVARRWSGWSVECQLIGRPVPAGQGAGASETRLYVRPVRTGHRPVTVRVVQKGTGRPLEGCEVFLSVNDYSTDRSDSCGITDHTGTVLVRPKSDGLHYLSVQYEDLVVRLPLVPAISGDLATVQVPTSGRRAEFVRPLRQLYSRLNDQTRSDNQLMAELKESINSRDAARVKELLELAGRPRLQFDQVQQQVERIRRRAEAAGEDVSQLAGQVLQIAKAATRPLPIQGLSQWAERVSILEKKNRLNRQIEQRQRALDWPGLLPLYEQLVQVDPADAAAADNLRRLRAALKTKSEEHAQARQFVDQQLPAIKWEQLQQQWPQVQRSVQTLLSAEDHLWLLKVRRHLNAWAKLLATEAQRLTDELESAKDDADELAELQQKLESLRRLHEARKRLAEQVDQFLARLQL